MKKKIGMILEANYSFPPDIRVEKEARVLIEAGFDVSLLTQKADLSQAAYQKLDYGLEIFRSEAYSQQNIRHYLKSKYTLVKKILPSDIDNFISEVHPDIIHCHDFPIIPSALKIAKKHNLPLVADLHENMPAALVAYRCNLTPLYRLCSYIIYNYYLWRWREKQSLRYCSRIIVVVPEAAERLLTDYKIPSEKICIVSNTEDETTFRTSGLDKNIIQKYKDSWVAIYIGGIGPHRGIDTAIRASSLTGEKIPGFKLLVVGIQGDKERQQVIKIAKKVDTGNYLELIDWVPSKTVNSYIAASKVCLVPHNDFEHTNTTVPHKIFQYMIMKKPVIVSNCTPLKRIVEETESGMVFNANNSKSLADCLIKIYKDWDLIAEQYGENGFRAALGKYSWKNDSQRLINMYKDLFNSTIEF